MPPKRGRPVGTGKKLKPESELSTNPHTIRSRNYINREQVNENDAEWRRLRANDNAATCRELRKLKEQDQYINASETVRQEMIKLKKGEVLADR